MSPYRYKIVPNDRINFRDYFPSLQFFSFHLLFEMLAFCIRYLKASRRESRQVPLISSIRTKLALLNSNDDASRNEAAITKSVCDELLNASLDLLKKLVSRLSCKVMRCQAITVVLIIVCCRVSEY